MFFGRLVNMLIDFYAELKPHHVKINKFDAKLCDRFLVNFLT